MKLTNFENRKNNNLKNTEIMKTQIKKLGTAILVTIMATSCSNNDITTETYVPSATAFKGIRENGLRRNTQNFTATAGTGTITLTSAKGVTITLNGNTLTKNGNPVTGAIDITFIELFDKGNMLITNKATMGVLPNGDKSVMKSGGEFFIKASQNGVDLATVSQIQLQVPANLAGAVDGLMTFWAGNTADPDNLAWVKPTAAVGGNTGGVRDGVVGFGQNAYNVGLYGFGWTNIDRFYSDPRPKTTILATVPAGYNNTNSSIFLSVDGEGQNQLAKFDTYNPTTQQFSEHYGQIPIGLACHIIFATEDNGNWRYAVKSVTTTAGAIYNFTFAETTIGTEAQMIAAINAIQ